MNNFLFCVLLYTYGSFMAVWFFQKHKIAKSLPLALVTHNPVQIFINLYIVSFTVIKYQLPFFDLTNMLALLTLYFPALIWEVSRKIKAPEEETEYVTYSKLFGYKKAVNFVFIVKKVCCMLHIPSPPQEHTANFLDTKKQLISYLLLHGLIFLQILL